jgi:hypothetical protein
MCNNIETPLQQFVQSAKGTVPGNLRLLAEC